VLPVFATTPASASPGWDFVGTSGFTYVGNQGAWVSSPAPSKGGNFRICMVTGSTTKQSYHLHEEDPNGGDEVGAASRTGSGCIDWYNIGRYVDGSNQRAEFYVFTGDSKVQSVAYYD
jgi:hypothetical protein